MRHPLHSASRGAATPARAIHYASEQAARASVEHRRARKAALRAELRARGESKIDYLAAVLGVSRSYIARCLSDRHRDELAAEHVEALGMKLGVAGIEGRAA